MAFGLSMVAAFSEADLGGDDKGRNKSQVEGKGRVAVSEGGAFAMQGPPSGRKGKDGPGDITA